MVAACAKLPVLYQPRDPRASRLWCLIDEHFDSFQQVYDETVSSQVRILAASYRTIRGGLHQVRGSARGICPSALHGL